MSEQSAGHERPLVAVENLVKWFDLSPPRLARMLGGGKRTILRAVDGVSFSIPAGETLSLVGESGCGKSTVARCIVGLHKPTDGRIKFDGRLIGARKSRDIPKGIRNRIQMIFQDPYASLNPRWKIGTIIAEPLRIFGRVGSAAEARDRTAQHLEQVGLSADDARRYPHEFSGGQRQRICIARALASDAEFLVCDEPTSALDVSIQAQVLNLLKDLQNDHGLTYLLISHDLSVVRHMSRYVGVMYLGRLVEIRACDPLFEHPLHPYTRLLLETIPSLDAIGRDRAPLSGEVPNPISPPSGCAFHPRCPFADARCRSESPVLKPADNRSVACHAVDEGRIDHAL